MRRRTKPCRRDGKECEAALFADCKLSVKVLSMLLGWFKYVRLKCGYKQGPWTMSQVDERESVREKYSGRKQQRHLSSDNAFAVDHCGIIDEVC